MGTNFYAGDFDPETHSDMDPKFHIGKRSAAGLYCWDCDLTLCEGGPDRVHSGRVPFATACRECGQEPAQESIRDSAAGRELGVNTAVAMRKTGVRSCGSFSWAMPPERLEGIAEIVDEYGRRYTRQAFLDMLSECPIRFTSSIGQWFS